MFSVYAGNARSLGRVLGAVASCSTQARGPAALKLRSPKLLCVRGTKHVLTAAECSERRSVSVTYYNNNINNNTKFIKRHIAVRRLQLDVVS